MQAFYENLDYVQNSTPPRIRFRFRLENTEDVKVRLFSFSGELMFLYPECGKIKKSYMNNLFDHKSQLLDLNKLTSRKLYLDYTLDHFSKDYIESKRDGNITLRIKIFCYENKVNPDGTSQPIGETSADVVYMNNNDIVIPRSQWTDILSDAGYYTYEIVELPIDYDRITYNIERLPVGGLADRLKDAVKELKKVSIKMDQGYWEEVVSESRKVLELLTKGEIIVNGENVSVSKAINNLLQESSIPKRYHQDFSRLLNILKSYTSMTHHIDTDGEEYTVPMYREDALFIYTTTTSILNLLARKLIKTIH